MAKLSDFIISQVRVKLLKVFLGQPEEMFYVRELTRSVKEEINAVRRELGHLQACGLVQSEKRGNRLYYQVKTNYSFYPELQSLVIKTTTVGQEIINNKTKLGFVKYAFISQKLARRLPRTADDVDLVLVGQIIMPQVAQVVKDIEVSLNTEINYSCMTEDEFSFRKSHKDPFIISLLIKPRIMLIGDEVQLAE